MGIAVPQYLEAYPRLRIGDVMSRGKTAVFEMSWFTYRTAIPEPIGSATFKWTGMAEIDLSFDFPGLFTGPLTGRQIISVRPRPRGALEHQMLFECAGCGRTVQRLFLRHNRFECRDCQFLKPRSAFVPKRIRDAEELRVLRAKLEFGREPGMHAKTFEKLKYRRAELEEVVRTRFSYAASDFNIVVQSSLEIEDASAR